MVAQKINLLAIVGPTASGKTSLSIKIAKKYGGEIIAADSRTVYKYLDIGTAKPTPQEQSGIRHWGLDLVGPGQRYSVVRYKEYATKTIKNIQDRGKLPILVGGSGLYIDAVLYDYQFAPENLEYRAELERYGNIELQKMIKEKGLIMPENINNKRYLIRTLEKGTVVSKKSNLLKSSVVIGINPPKEILVERIEKRAYQMIKQGVINEIINAYKLYDIDSEALSGGIYKSFRPFIDGNLSQDDAIINFVASDLKLVKKQITWFKRNADIIWYESATEAYKDVVSNKSLG